MKAFMMFVLFLVSVPVLASANEMRRFIELTDGYVNRAVEGYRVVAQDSIRPRGGLQTFLRNTTKTKERDWRQFVLTGGEYDHVSLSERRAIAADPLKTLEVSALLEIEEVVAIYKGNKLIGYFIQITDHVQAAIYQDGAWYDTFFDANLKLIDSTEQSS